MTFYHFGAIVPFETKEWDKKIGDWLVFLIKLTNALVKGICRVQEYMALNDGLDK